MNRQCICALLLALLFDQPSVIAETLFFTNEEDWVRATTNTALFPTMAPNVGLAEEASVPTSNNVDVGPSLTFRAAATGLPWSFKIVTLQPGAGFTFNDNEQGGASPPYAGFEDALSVGDIDDYENDHCAILVLDGPPLRGLALEIGDNEPGYSDQGVFVYGTGGALVGYSPTLPAVSGGFAFLGIVSDDSISRVVLQGDTDGDDMSIRHLRFARHRAGIPRLSTIANNGSNRIQLRWPSLVDWIYDLESSTNLASGFIVSASNLVATPPENSVTNTFTGAAMFYRLRARIQP